MKPHLITALAGLWLIMAPARLDLDQLPSNNEHVTGPVIAALGILSACETTRGLRWGAAALGVWLMAAPFLLGYWQSQPAAGRNEIICGAAVIITSVLRGRIKEKRGGGWSVLFTSG